MKEKDAFTDFLSNGHEVETFFHDFISQVSKRRPKPGADVTEYADQLRLKMPAVLKGAKITWASETDSAAARERPEQVLVFVRPGHANAVGLTVGCITIRRVRVCLECGWFWCRIVIVGRF